MAREGPGSSSRDGDSPDDISITVLGVDPADRRALAELARWVPTDATGLYWIPPESRPTAIAAELSTNPPGLLLALARQLRGRATDPAILPDAVDAAADERAVSVRALRRKAMRPAVPRSRWWPISAWVATALGFGAFAAAVGLLAFVGGLLVSLFAALLVIGAVALLAGFALAHEAAGIRRSDASIAALIADGVADFGAQPVVVLPVRNAAGVAVALRERGFDAEVRVVVPDG